VPKVTGHGGGSALLREPETVRAIFRAIMRRIKKIPVTVKMRLGFSDSSGREACQIARIAEEEGLSGVAVHGRTREQLYSGTADYGAIGRVKAAVGIPVIGNGDVVDGESALRLRREAGVDGVMLGRGALGNPWIYREVEAAVEGQPAPARPTDGERKQTLLKHFDYELRYHERDAVLRMRRVACWYFKDMPNAARFRDRINSCPDAASFREAVEEFWPGRAA
jgi:nifR3 family TIM-barrel protein